MERYTIVKFNQEFPDDNACLEWLFRRFYPEGIIECKICKKPTKHHRVKSRPSYSCDVCGHHVHPTADTIMHKSSTPLKLWFYAIYLMSSTRMGISAKQLERELGVTYKTAWRMFKQIRSMMNDYNDDSMLTGTVEVDETYIGGVQKGFRGRNPAGGNKTPVMGMVERGGRVRTKVVKNAKAPSLMPHVQENVEPGSLIMSDQLLAYKVLPRLGYNHLTINHTEQYVNGSVHTNTIEGFWSVMKNGIRGVYRHVEPQYLNLYAAEYAWRYSRRNSKTPMFELLINQVTK
jgi:transposase